MFSLSAMSDSLLPCGLQHTRLPCPPPPPRACSDSCPWSQWCHPTISSSCYPLLLPSIFPIIIVFSNDLTLHIRWQKYWSFSFSISPSNEYSGLIAFRIDWFDRLAIQGTLKSLLQQHSSKVSILRCSALFMVQLSYLHMTTRKTIVLTRWNFVGKVMSLLFNMLSRLVIAFLPRGKCLLISWLQSPSAVILEPPKKVSHCFPIYAMKWWDRMPWSFSECWTLSQLFHSPLSLSSRLFSESLAVWNFKHSKGATNMLWFSPSPSWQTSEEELMAIGSSSSLFLPLFWSL